MEDLLVVRYTNEHAAQANMNTLHNLSDYWVVDIHDAVAVVRDADGKLHIQDSYKPTTGQGAGWGVLLGTILGSMALVPFAAGLSAAAAAGAVAAGSLGGATLGAVAGAGVAATDKELHGLSDEFVWQVTATIKRGQSAIFALVERYHPDGRYKDELADYFRGTGGDIIRTNLSPTEQERVQQILSGTDKSR
jgi:uncharacterized membrane protein